MSICAQLLTVNERYHALLQLEEQQKDELIKARAENRQLRPAVASLEEKLAVQQIALGHARDEAQKLRAQNDLQLARISAADAEREDLHRVVKDYAARLLEAESELATLRQRNAEADAMLAAHWDSGYEEGVKQQHVELNARIRRVEAQAKQREHDAYQRGKTEHAEETSARLLRDQAERRLLLRRAEAAQLQQNDLQLRLQREKQAHAAAAGRSNKLEERLRGVRHEKVGPGRPSICH